MESPEKSDMAKKFDLPTNGNAGLYIYRAGSFGGAIKKEVWVDGKCVGETAPNVFFYKKLQGNQDHKVSTESGFLPNDLLITTEAGKHYFIQQFIKMGVFVGGASVELVEEDKGKTAVKEPRLAIKDNCSK